MENEKKNTGRANVLRERCSPKVKIKNHHIWNSVSWLKKKEGNWASDKQTVRTSSYRKTRARIQCCIFSPANEAHYKKKKRSNARVPQKKKKRRFHEVIEVRCFRPCFTLILTCVWTTEKLGRALLHTCATSTTCPTRFCHIRFKKKKQALTVIKAGRWTRERKKKERSPFYTTVLCAWVLVC